MPAKPVSSNNAVETTIEGYHAELHSKKSNTEWFMELVRSRENRLRYNERVDTANRYRNGVEIAVKTCITGILATALFLGSPATLCVAGASVAIFLSSLMTQFLGEQLTIVKNSREYIFGQKFEESIETKKLPLEQFRNRYEDASLNNQLDNVTSYKGKQLTKGAVAIILSYALYTTLISSTVLGLPLMIASVCFSISLLFSPKDHYKPFIENKKELANLFPDDESANAIVIR